MDLQEVRILIMAGSDKDPHTIGMVQIDGVGKVTLEAQEEYRGLVDHLFVEILPRLVKKPKKIINPKEMAN
jgi:hypothetical protein